MVCADPGVSVVHALIWMCTGSGAWNPEMTKQARVALLADEVTHPVVVGTAAGGGTYGA